MSESRILRDRVGEALDAGVARGSPPAAGGRVELVQTVVDGAYPAVAAAFYTVRPLRIDGAEAEGGGAVFSADSSRTFVVFNLGSKVPPLGTKLLAHDAGGRWVARYDG